MQSRSLAIYLFGNRIGTVRTLPSGRHAFEYSEVWLDQGPGIPLSLSMPLAAAPYPHNTIAPFLWGLLPDNEKILNQIALAGDDRVSPRNVAALLAKVGLDCAGAVQVVPDRRSLTDLQLEGPVEWLTDEQIGSIVRRMRDGKSTAVQPGAWIEGRFSLAGAQPKFAMTRDPATGAFGFPSGRTPSTHIFKPPMPDLADQLHNEHVCLSIAGRLGINAANSQVMHFDGEPVIAVERYDRSVVDGSVRRLHQEDMCQAMSVYPTSKYQSDGGPSASDIARNVLHGSAYPATDVETFARSLALNFLIGGTDAHGKNYSIIFGRGGKYRLAPVYDINSLIPYGLDRKTRLAMSIGGKYRIADIQPRHFEKLALDIGMEPAAMRQILEEMVDQLPDVASAVVAECRQKGVESEIFGKLIDGVSVRCHDYRMRLTADVTMAAGNARQAETILADRHGDPADDPPAEPAP